MPFNWRGWWDYGTGALGDMGCHLLETPFSVLNLKYASEVEASVGSVYYDEFKRGYYPDSCPPSSHVTLKFPKTNKTKGDVTVHWMDGGIQPTRPEELLAKREIWRRWKRNAIYWYERENDFRNVRQKSSAFYH